MNDPASSRKLKVRLGEEKTRTTPYGCGAMIVIALFSLFYAGVRSVASTVRSRVLPLHHVFYHYAAVTSHVLSLHCRFVVMLMMHVNPRF